MINKEQFLEILEGKLDVLDTIITERAETLVSDLIAETAEPLLEMTQGHKEMVQQHLANKSIVDLTPKGKDAHGEPVIFPKGTIAKVLKNDSKFRDDYNQLGDNPDNKLRKSKKNFTGKNYTTNERELRSYDASDPSDFPPE